MTIWIVELSREGDREAILTRLRAKGNVQEFAALRHLVQVEGAKKTLERVSGVIAVHDPDQPVQAGATLSFVPKGPNYWTSNFGLALASKKTPFNSFHDFIEHNPHTVDFSPAEDGAGVSVYVVDAGLEAHTEFDGGRLQARIYEAYAGAIHWHGVAVASVLAGATLGMAPGATIYDSRCFDVNNTGTISSITLAIDAAADHYAAGSVPGVLNFSGYSTAASNPFGTMVADVVDVGLPFIGIAGNEGSDLASVGSWPGESPDCVTCAGLDVYQRRHVDSNYGDAVDLWAYYGKVYVAALSNSFLRASGTSFSAPIVSGIAARLLEGTSKMTTRAEVEGFYIKLKKASIKGLWDADGTPKPEWKRAFLAA